MSYSARVFEVMVASPGDVQTERDLAREVMLEWNNIHSKNRKLILQPVGWETHSAPELGDRAQSLINRNLLEQCDLLIAIFWSRIGLPTGESLSGSVEEIERHRNSGKPAMLYFSDKPIAPTKVDHAQLLLLREFEKKCKDLGLVEHFVNETDFKEKLRRQIQLELNKNDYNEGDVNSPKEGEASQETKLSPPFAQPFDTFSIEARTILIEAAQAEDGLVLHRKWIGGELLGTRESNFFPDGASRREIAKWEGALQQLEFSGYLRAQSDSIYALTTEGFNMADLLAAHLLRKDAQE